MMVDWLISFLLVSGAFFVFISGLGLMRLPDFFSRMHAATKASSFGCGQIMLAVALYFWEPWIVIKCVMVVLFIFATAPIAAHMLGRASYFLRIPMWPGTVIDELKGKYDLKNHTLKSEKERDKV